jgi:hypothetical protein
MSAKLTLAAAALFLVPLMAPAVADEFPAGDPVELHGMEIAGVYLQPVEMAGAMDGQDPASTDIHLEADIHAIDGNAHGFSAGDWLPYLAIDYTLAKEGSDWTQSGALHPMVASDGPHYGANVALDGPGLYHVAFRINPPQAHHFMHHTDAETGIAPWWDPIDYTGSFKFIGVGKKGDY